MSRRIDRLYVFAQGRFAAFDADGEQVTKLSGDLLELWFTEARRQNYDVDGMEVHQQSTGEVLTVAAKIGSHVELRNAVPKESCSDD